jgi:hypothetical protein
VLSDFAVPPALRPRRVEPGGNGWSAGRFTAGELARLAAHLEEHGARPLAAMPLERRLAVWTETVEALLDPESAERRALVPPLVETSRLSPEGLVEGLRVMLGGVEAAPAAALAGRVGAARGPLPLGAVVLAGNVPGLAAQALLPALLLGRPLLVKSARNEPLFAPALLAALAAREPVLGEAYAAVAFPGDDEALADAALGSAERVVAYGGAEALGALARRLGPRLVAHGPKASVALVGGAIDTVAVARALARDVALFDQRGCLSVHAVYAEGDPRELGEALAWGLALEHLRLPPGPAEPETWARVHQARGAAEVAGRLVPRLEAAQGTVIHEPAPSFAPSPGLRTVRVHGVETLRAAVEALRPWTGKLQGAALAGETAWSLTSGLAELGISRVAEAGRLQSADASWQNGGIDPLAAFAPER